MGFRQPFTLHTDAKNPGLIGVGEYCHDGSTDRAQRAPAGVCSWNLVNKPANIGWPFCFGDFSPANTAWRWNYANQTPTGQQYDCSQEQIPSDIRWAPEGQTSAAPTFDGLDMIPKTKTRDDLEEVPERRQHRPPERGRLRRPLDAGGMQPMAGPIFRYNAATAGLGGFPAYYDGSWLINNRGATTVGGSQDPQRQPADAGRQGLGSRTTPRVRPRPAEQPRDRYAVRRRRRAVHGPLSRHLLPQQHQRGSSVQIVKISFDVYEETAARP